MDKSTEPFIATEAKEDIYYLKEEIKGYSKKIIPSICGDSKSSARLVQEQIDQYVNAIFKLASNNISVNGLPFDDVFQDEDGFEQFDEKLLHETEDVIQQVSACRTRIALLRKTVPDALLKASLDDLEGIMDVDFEGHVDPQGDVILESLAVRQAIANSREHWSSAVTALSTDVPTVLEKWTRANAILDDFGVPHPNGR
ncbi:hypothetical protein BC829DRAFT_52500 [Chytridium lagenaria]|nr:hypothetical protein BC829DRAFT_52500 [Chytridium lagenaria]